MDGLSRVLSSTSPKLYLKKGPGPHRPVQIWTCCTKPPLPNILDFLIVYKIK